MFTSRLSALNSASSEPRLRRIISSRSPIGSSPAFVPPSSNPSTTSASSSTCTRLACASCSLLSSSVRTAVKCCCSSSHSSLSAAYCLLPDQRESLQSELCQVDLPNSHPTSLPFFLLEQFSPAHTTAPTTPRSLSSFTLYRTQPSACWANTAASFEHPSALTAQAKDWGSALAGQLELLLRLVAQELDRVARV